MKRLLRKVKTPRGRPEWYTSDQRLLNEACDLLVEIEARLQHLPDVWRATQRAADETAAARRAIDALTSAVVRLAADVEGPT